MVLSGRDIEYYIETKKLIIDPIEKSQFQQNGIDLVLQDIQGHPEFFTPCKFYLGCLREKFAVPDDLMAFVQLRSTWARNGIMIPPTVIDAGFIGDITLEIVCFKDTKVPYGERFAHVIFEKLTSHSEPYKGKYQNQAGITGPIKD